MKLKKITGILGLPAIISTGILGFSQSATAVTFTKGDALSFGVAAQIENITIPPQGSPVPIFIDFQPPDNVPGGNTPSDTTITGVGNISAMPEGFASCNTGGLVSAACTLGSNVRDFNVDVDVASPPLTKDTGVMGLDGTNSFLTVVNDGSLVPSAASTWYFGLDTTTIVNPSGPGVLNPITFLPGSSDGGNDCLALVAGDEATGCDLAIDFEAFGQVRDTATGQIELVKYFYAVTGLEIAGGLGTNAAPYFTTTFAQAGNLRVEMAETVPEPGSVVALLALGSVGSIEFLRRKKANK